MFVLVCQKRPTKVSKRNPLQCPITVSKKRPIEVSKETHYIVQRDLLLSWCWCWCPVSKETHSKCQECQMRPITVSDQCQQRDPLKYQKRPISVSREIHYCLGVGDGVQCQKRDPLKYLNLHQLPELPPREPHPPPRKQFCLRSCSNKHAHTCGNQPLQRSRCVQAARREIHV